MTEMEFIHLDITHFGCLCARVTRDGTVCDKNSTFVLAISIEPTL